MASKLTATEDDCYARLKPDEEYFTLMARDPDFQLSIRQWAFNRHSQIENGTRPDTPEERQQISDAIEVGRKGAQWREKYLWEEKKRVEDIKFDNDGYPLTGEHRRRQTTTSGHDVVEKTV